MFSASGWPNGSTSGATTRHGISRGGGGDGKVENVNAPERITLKHNITGLIDRCFRETSQHTH